MRESSLKLIYRSGDSKPLRVYIAAELDGNKINAIDFDPWKAASCADHSSSSSSRNVARNTGAVLHKTTSLSATLFIATLSGEEAVKGTSMNSALMCVRDEGDNSFINFRDLDERELGVTVGTVSYTHLRAHET